MIVREGSESLVGGMVTANPPHLVGASEAILTENTDPRSLLGAKTRAGRSQFGINNGSSGASVASVNGIKAWTRDNATQFLIGRIGTTFYDISAVAWSSIGIGGTDGSYMRAAALNDTLAVVVDGLAPKKFTGTTLSDLGGSPPAEAKFAVVFNSKLILSGNDANPQTIYGSATNNPEDFTAPNDAFSITTQDGGGDTIKGLVTNKKVLCICSRNYTDILIGTSVFDYRVERLIDRGLVSTTGVASAGEVAFFASDDAVYMVAGAKVSDITTLKLRSSYYDDITDKSKVTLVAKGDLLMVIDYGNDKAYVCAYKYNRWAVWTSQPWSSADTANDQTLYAATDGGSTTQVWKLDTGTTDGASTIASVTWRTPNFGFGSPDAIKNLAAVRVHAKFGIGTVAITYFKNGGSHGSATDVTFGSTIAGQEHDWGGRSGQSKIRGHYIGVKFAWTGDGTLYGYALYAEVTTDGKSVPPEF